MRKWFTTIVLISTISFIIDMLVKYHGQAMLYEQWFSIVVAEFGLQCTFFLISKEYEDYTTKKIP